MHGPLYYLALESAKSEGLRAAKGNYLFKIALPSEAKLELQLWINNIETAGGRWSKEESILHINVLELQAALFALQSLYNNDTDVHIQMQLDNTTAVAYINSMGGSKSPPCNRIAKQIWLWAIERNI